MCFVGARGRLNLHTALKFLRTSEKWQPVDYIVRSVLQRTFGASLQRLPVRLASGEAYLPEKPPEGETSEKVMGWRWMAGRVRASEGSCKVDGT